MGAAFLLYQTPPHLALLQRLPGPQSPAAVSGGEQAIGGAVCSVGGQLN